MYITFQGRANNGRCFSFHCSTAPRRTVVLLNTTISPHTMTIIADKEPKICCQDVALANLFLSADLFNMSRNIRIILMMLCLTVIIQLVIYYEESKQTPRKHSGHLRELLQLDRSSNQSELSSAGNLPITETPPAGDGELYKLIESSRTAFVPDYRKQVLIVAYQRVGSSFFGKLFDNNPSFFYVYEPLDSVYAEMYGTRGGYNVPSDITYLPNGEPRNIPDQEVSAVRHLLTDILSCNVDRLPAGYILHKYWFSLSEDFMPSWHPYRTCLKNHRLLKARETCRESFLKNVCPERFGVDPEQQDYCFRKLASSKLSHSDPFHKYRRCLTSHYVAAKSCINMFTRKCERNNSLWAAKTVRATMEEVAELLEQNPNARIVHLIRDPRPVAVSRSTDKSYRGIYSGDIHTKKGGDKVREAHVYCGTVVRDIVYRRKLEEAYPGKIVQVIYEDFVQNPEAYARALYAFLDEPIPNGIVGWLRESTNGKRDDRNATSRMNAWKKHLTYLEGKMIMDECRYFYDILNYKWPYNKHE